MLTLSGLLPARAGLAGRQRVLASPAVDSSAIWGALRVVEAGSELAVTTRTVATISIAVISEASA